MDRHFMKWRRSNAEKFCTSFSAAIGDWSVMIQKNKYNKHEF